MVKLLRYDVCVHCPVHFSLILGWILSVNFYCLMCVKYQYSKHIQSPPELANYEGFDQISGVRFRALLSPKGSTSPPAPRKLAPAPQSSQKQSSTEAPPLENIPRQLNSFPSPCPSKGNGGAWGGMFGTRGRRGGGLGWGHCLLNF